MGLYCICGGVLELGIFAAIAAAIGYVMRKLRRQRASTKKVVEDGHRYLDRVGPKKDPCISPCCGGRSRGRIHLEGPFRDSG